MKPRREDASPVPAAANDNALRWTHGNVLGPAPGVGVVAKRPQGLLTVGGGSFRADGGAAFLRS
jgi:hypothetical protein